MKFLLSVLSIIFCVSVKIEAKDHLITDDDYYNQGVLHYDNGEFKKSFIVFFNLSEKGHKSSIHNLSNMYFEGIGTTQDFKLSLKYTWLCSLNGNKRCLRKVDKVIDKLIEDDVNQIAEVIETMLEKEYIEDTDQHAAFKLAYWFEKISPEIDLEKSYLWYSVSVSAGNYKAMKLRDRVGDSIEKEVLTELQKEAFDIFTKQKYLSDKINTGDEL